MAWFFLGVKNGLVFLGVENGLIFFCRSREWLDFFLELRMARCFFL